MHARTHTLTQLELWQGPTFVEMEAQVWHIIGSLQVCLFFFTRSQFHFHFHSQRQYMENEMKNEMRFSTKYTLELHYTLSRGFATHAPTSAHLPFTQHMRAQTHTLSGNDKYTQRLFENWRVLCRAPWQCCKMGSFTNGKWSGMHSIWKYRSKPRKRMLFFTHTPFFWSVATGGN